MIVNISQILFKCIDDQETEQLSDLEDEESNGRPSIGRVKRELLLCGM